MPPLTKQTISEAQKRDLCTLAQTILDTNSAIYGNASMKKFWWQMQALFLWDTLLCVLLNLSKVGFYSPLGLDTTWSKFAEVYSNNEEQKSIACLYQQGHAQGLAHNPPEPFVLRAGFHNRAARPRRAQSQQAAQVRRHRGRQRVCRRGTNFDELSGNLHGTDMNLNSNLSLGSSDGAFWDQLCRETNLG
jgi:hypothetical protein